MVHSGGALVGKSDSYVMVEVEVVGKSGAKKSKKDIQKEVGSCAQVEVDRKDSYVVDSDSPGYSMRRMPRKWPEVVEDSSLMLYLR